MSEVELRGVKASKESKGSKSAIWGHVPAIIALLSVGASLFGYGVVTGLASSVNLDQGTLLGGAFDLITLVWPGMLAIISGVNDLPWLQILLEIAKGATATSFAVGLVVFLLVVAIRYKRLIVSGRTAFTRGYERFRARRSVPGGGFLVAIAAAFVAIIGSMAITVLGTLILFFVLLGLTVLPSFGYLSGQAFVQMSVVDPPTCASTPSRQQRMDRKVEVMKAREAGRKPQPQSIGAACVLVSSIDPTKPFQRFGRSVVSSGSSTLIWDPQSGRGERIPTATMTVTSIDEEALQVLLRSRARTSNLSP